MLEHVNLPFHAAARAGRAEVLAVFENADAVADIDLVSSVSKEPREGAVRALACGGHKLSARHVRSAVHRNGDCHVGQTEDAAGGVGQHQVRKHVIRGGGAGGGHARVKGRGVDDHRRPRARRTRQITAEPIDVVAAQRREQCFNAVQVVFPEKPHITVINDGVRDYSVHSAHPGGVFGDDVEHPVHRKSADAIRIGPPVGIEGAVPWDFDHLCGRARVNAFGSGQDQIHHAITVVVHPDADRGAFGVVRRPLHEGAVHPGFVGVTATGEIVVGFQTHRHLWRMVGQTAGVHRGPSCGRAGLEIGDVLDVVQLAKVRVVLTGASRQIAGAGHVIRGPVVWQLPQHEVVVGRGRIGA